MINQILFNRTSHFHFLIEIRSGKNLTNYFKSKDLIGFQNLSGLVSKQFSNLLNAYAKAYNEMYDRKGKLFQKSLNRKEVKNNSYYTRLITYIHQNPVHHGFVKDPLEWPFSSFHIMISGKPTQLERERVLDWYGGEKSFLEFHQQNREINIEEVQ